MLFSNATHIGAFVRFIHNLKKIKLMELRYTYIDMCVCLISSLKKKSSALPDEMKRFVLVSIYSKTGESVYKLGRRFGELFFGVCTASPFHPRILLCPQVMRRDFGFYFRRLFQTTDVYYGRYPLLKTSEYLLRGLSHGKKRGSI